MSYPIPASGLDDRLAFVGTSGSGKTYAAGTAVERLLASGAKVVIIDPLDVWWGLRVKADGRGDGFPVVIFGGAHADMPITEAAGALLGETVATAEQSCIVSLGGMLTKSSERRFMLAFLDKLYRKATGEPMHLVFDEADLWAPQKSSEPGLQNLMEQIVRRGRVKGFIPWLITQRPAVISKDVLSQADGIVAMKLTAEHDRRAIGGWVEATADSGQWKKLDAKLPTLQRGNGIVWIPGRNMLTEATFPEKVTFDSSSTPKRGETKRSATLKPIDLGKLKEKLASLEPRQEPSRAATAATSADAQKAIRDAEDRARAQGRAEGERIGFTNGYSQAQREAAAALQALRPPEPSLASLPKSALPQMPIRTAVMIESKLMGMGSGEVGEGGLRRILIALAQCPRGLTNRQIGVRAGLSSQSGTFSTYLSKARTNGWIDGRGTLQITQAGIAALGRYEPLPRGSALLDYWVRDLGDSGASRLLRAVAEAYPGSLSNAKAAERAGLSANSGTFSTYLSKLRTLELIQGRGELRASDDLFDEAA